MCEDGGELISFTTWAWVWRGIRIVDPFIYSVPVFTYLYIYNVHVLILTLIFDCHELFMYFYKYILRVYMCN